MKAKFAQMIETLKENKPVVLRVVGVTLGALIGVAVAAIVVNAQEAALLEEDELLALEADEADEVIE
jgi:hypothetical protein